MNNSPATVVIGNVDTASAVTGKASIDAVERSRPQVPGTQVSDVAGGRLTYR